MTDKRLTYTLIYALVISCAFPVSTASAQMVTTEPASADATPGAEAADPDHKGRIADIVVTVGKRSENAHPVHAPERAPSMNQAPGILLSSR